MKPKPSIVHHFLDSAALYPQKEILKIKRQGHWEGIAYSKYLEIVETLAHAFLSSNVAPGDRVALMSSSRVEWTYCDFAIMGIKAITVPIYPNLTNDDFEYIINNSKPKVLVLETRQHQKQWQEVKSRCPSVTTVMSFEKADGFESQSQSWAEFLNQGRRHLEKNKGVFRSLAQSLTPAETATILYTSGTTGKPKGVVLTHKQVMSEISDVVTALNLSEEDRSLTFLPFSHIMGRIESWGHVYVNFQICYAQSIEMIRPNLQEVSPTFMLAVPRIFEKIYGTLKTQIQVNPVKKRVFEWALGVGRSVSQLKSLKRPIPPSLLLQYLAAKKIVFAEVKKAMGGRLRFAFSGGAPLSTEISEFFHATDLLVLEGYGLTETTGSVCLNRVFHYRFGTVGLPLADVKIRLAEDGEILVKSDKIMKEYYLDPEATAEVMEDGYFKTGDIGEWTETNELRITDRKKDLIKTAGGKFVAPQKLENLIKNEPLISQAHIHGDQKKFVIALLTLDKQNLKQFASLQNIKDAEMSDLVQNPKVLEYIRRWIAKVNSELASYETVKNFSILPKDFSIEAGEMTPSLKLKRRVIDQRYKEAIDKLYS